MVLPLCRCRVLYIGSSVPTITKDGLQGIQQPLRERYPVEDTPETRGIDSWWVLLLKTSSATKKKTCVAGCQCGLMVFYSSTSKETKRAKRPSFLSIRCTIALLSDTWMLPDMRWKVRKSKFPSFIFAEKCAVDSGGGERFLPLDSPFANIPDSSHPPIFAAIMRRTTGVKVCCKCVDRISCMRDCSSSIKRTVINQSKDIND